MPLVGIIDEFGYDDFRYIVLNYDQICTRLKYDKNLADVSFSDVLNYLFEFISLGRVYAHSDRYMEAVFGQDFLDLMVNHAGFSSSDPKDYMNVYSSMLDCSTTFIPPFSGEFDDYVYESGNNYEVEKLLMGIYCLDSCLGLNDAGEEAYLEALTSRRADVVFVRKKETLEFVGRFLMFRKGNFVIMAPIYGTNSYCRSLYQEEFLSQIGNQILDLAHEAGDSLDYVFAKHIHLMDELMPNNTVVFNRCFKEEIPHCDITSTACLIAARREDIELCPDGDVSIYLKKRNDVLVKDQDCRSFLTRIKALEISRERDLLQKKKLEDEFDEILKTNYQKVYVGQDWYIALREDGCIEKTLLNTNDDRQREEIFSILDQVIDLSSNSGIDFLDSDIKRL